jgi:hypothetical protein
MQMVDGKNVGKKRKRGRNVLLLNAKPRLLSLRHAFLHHFVAPEARVGREWLPRRRVAVAHDEDMSVSGAEWVLVDSLRVDEHLGVVAWGLVGRRPERKTVGRVASGGCGAWVSECVRV